MSSFVWLRIFVFVALVVDSHQSIIGTLLELPIEFRHFPSKDVLNYIKSLKPENLKVIREAIEKNGGQYQSTDIDVLQDIAKKDRKLHDTLATAYDKIDKRIKGMESVEGFLFINSLRTEFGDVNVKDKVAVAEMLAKWKKEFKNLDNKVIAELKKEFQSVVSSLKPAN
ncbi:hypothetical protein M3Y94_01065400 [Aphelenchoides besseyi]|nr:hypothetical protein M3Y94_01065400 [Aphelenchoides besseyi]KAI6224217.1 Fatty-acid and retinol-binding protein 2 [Aphelenchoides besseyi]